MVRVLPDGRETMQRTFIGFPCNTPPTAMALESGAHSKVATVAPSSGSVLRPVATSTTQSIHGRSTDFHSEHAIFVPSADQRGRDPRTSCLLTPVALSSTCTKGWRCLSLRTIARRVPGPGASLAFSGLRRRG